MLILTSLTGCQRSDEWQRGLPFLCGILPLVQCKFSNFGNKRVILRFSVLLLRSPLLCVRNTYAGKSFHILITSCFSFFVANVAKVEKKERRFRQSRRNSYETLQSSQVGLNIRRLMMSKIEHEVKAIWAVVKMTTLRTTTSLNYCSML